MRNKQPISPLETKIDKIANLLGHLIAIQMYTGGATQSEIATSMGIAVGKVNRLVKGVKTPKANHEEN